MYSFRDTVTAALPTSTLSAESVTFNEVVLETAVPEFRVLQVSGREIMSRDITDYEIGGIEGTLYRSSKYPARVIKVKYQIKASSDTAYRTAFNLLNQYLSVVNKKLKFADEPDKYFIASSASCDDPDPGCNSGIGEIEFICNDPRKYSTTTKTVTAYLVDGVLSATINNTGNVPVSIDYTITNPANEENGYIGIVSDKGIIQLGDEDEVDDTARTNDKQLIKDLVSVNDISPYRDTGASCILTDTTETASGGQLSTGTVNGYRVLKLSRDGSGSSGKWRGGMITYPLMESGSAVSCLNFYCYMEHWFQCAMGSQTGEQIISFTTSDNRHICGYRFVNSSSTSDQGYLYFLANGKSLKKISIDNGARTNRYRADTDLHGCNDIRKEGSKVTFYYAGKYYPFEVDAIENMACSNIQIFLGQYGTRTVVIDGLGQYFTRNYVTELRFKRLANKWKDSKNRFSEGSIIKIDGSKALITNHRNKPRMGDEVVGSTYFKADPGTTTIKFTHSDWMTAEPTITATIREAWI